MCLVWVHAVMEGTSGGGVANVDADEWGTTSWWQWVSPLIATGGRPGPPKRCTTGAPALCLLEPDLLAVAMCVGGGPPASVVFFDPMLEELAAALVVCRFVEAPSPGIAEPPPATAAPSSQPPA